MIVRPLDGGLSLLTQEDHAHVAGELAAHLRDAPAPVSGFVAAARLHDNGWRETDARPILNPESRRPHSFIDIPDDVYLPTWERGIARAVAVDPYVGLLVSLHGMQFFQRTKNPHLRAFHDAERKREDHLLAALRLGGSWQDLPEPVRTHFAWIRFLDGVSLFLCGEWGDARELNGPGGAFRLTRTDTWTATMAPWPFRADAIEATVPLVQLPGQTYIDVAALDAAFSKAPRTTVRLRLASG